MTVAFDFEDKKEEEDNSGKVKVRQFSFAFCSHTGSSNSQVVLTDSILCLCFIKFTGILFFVFTRAIK